MCLSELENERGFRGKALAEFIQENNKTHPGAAPLSAGISSLAGGCSLRHKLALIPNYPFPGPSLDPSACECLLWELSGSHLCLNWIKSKKIFTVVAPHTGDHILTLLHPSKNVIIAVSVSPWASLLSFLSFCTVNNLETSG